tara:strand:+ start:1239 stop:1724 length:486 start_codon:yes stop_codon:yes gene_type:complete
MPSFDVVSRIDHQEIDNAIGNAIREITTRYDFKGSNTSIEKKDNSIVVLTDDEMKAGQVNDMLVTHFVRRKVDPLCLKKKELEKAGGNKIKQIYDLIEGIDQSICKKLIADVKSSKIKVQVKINGNELRVDGKKKDDLQSVIQLIESSNIGIPIQFINFRD